MEESVQSVNAEYLMFSFAKFIHSHVAQAPAAATEWRIYNARNLAGIKTENVDARDLYIEKIASFTVMKPPNMLAEIRKTTRALICPF